MSIHEWIEQGTISDRFAEIRGIKELVRCKDCKYFEIKDFWGEFNGIPVLGTSNQPTCMKWGDGDCKTSPDGFCFLAERL